MHQSTLNPPKFVQDEEGFVDALHVWSKTTPSTDVDPEGQIDLAIAYGADIGIQQLIGMIGAIAQGYLLQQPEIKAMSDDQREVAIQGGMYSILSMALKAAIPGFDMPHPNVLPAPAELEDNVGAMQVATLWIDSEAQTTYVEFIDDPKNLGAETFGSLLATLFVDGGHKDDGTYDAAFVEEALSAAKTRAQGLVAELSTAQ